jgi:hypothetical protein
MGMLVLFLQLKRKLKKLKKKLYVQVEDHHIVLYSYIWGGSSHGYSYRLSVGASSGLLTVCDSFEVESSSSGSSVNN